MKYYNIKFTFNIPVAIDDSDDEVDAYYEGRKHYYDYKLNEAEVKVEPITKETYDTASRSANKLHEINNEK